MPWALPGTAPVVPLLGQRSSTTSACRSRAPSLPGTTSPWSQRWAWAFHWQANSRPLSARKAWAVPLASSTILIWLEYGMAGDPGGLNAN